MTARKGNLMPAEPSRDVLARAKELAAEFAVKNIVVASTTGRSARDVLDALGEGFNVVAVGIAPEVARVRDVEAISKDLRSRGAKYVVGVPILSHPISGLEEVTGPVTSDPVRLIQHVLRIFGEGAKVCIEVAMMAADRDAIPLDEDCLAIARPPERSNCPHTAMVLHPVKSHDFFSKALRVKALALVPGPRDHWFANGPLWSG
jgi:hypothetical protein